MPQPEQDPRHTADRLVALNRVHGWMPFQTQAAMATTPVSNAGLASMTGALRHAYGSVSKTLSFIHDDPLLQKDPSLGLALKMYMSGTIAPWPVQDRDLVHIQRQLQGQGFGQGLKVTGVWDNTWNAAFGQYLSNYKTSQLGGGQPGSSPFSSVLHGLNSLLPREAANGIVGFIKNLPDSARNDLRTLAGSIGGTGYNIAHPGVFLHPLSREQGTGEASASAAAENVIPGGHVTPAQSYAGESTRKEIVDTVQTAGDMFLAHGLFGAGKTVASAAGESFLKGATREEASQGSGLVAKSLFDKGYAERVPGSAMKAIYQRPVAGSLSQATGIIPATPILRYTGPVADKLIGTDGLYYRARTLLAQPYRLPPVRVLGTAVGQAGLAGAKVHGVAAGESVLGGRTSELQAAIDRVKVINNADVGVQNKLAFTVAGHTIKPGIDTLAWFLHPPISGTGTLSESVGHDLGSFHKAANDALGPHTGFSVSIEHGYNYAHVGGKYMKFQDLVNHLGGDSAAIKFWVPKIAQHAAGHYADMEEQRILAQAGGQAEIDEAGGALAFKRAAAREAYNDPDKLVTAMYEMIANDNPLENQWGGNDELAKRISREILTTIGGKRGWLRGNGPNFIAAGDDMRAHIIPHITQLFHDALPKGTLGLVRREGYLFKDEAANDAYDFRSRYWDALQKMTNAPPGTEDPGAEMDAVVSDMANWLHDNFDIDAKRMPMNNEDVMNLVEKMPDSQASKLFKIRRTTPAVEAALSRIRDAGYEPVMGADIGHAFYDQPHVDIMDGALTTRRRLLEKAGLSPEVIPTHDAAFHMHQLFLSNLIDKVGKGELRLMPFDTPRGIVNSLREGVTMPKSLGIPSTMMKWGPGHWSFKAEVDKVTAELLPRIKSQVAGMQPYEAEALARSEAERRVAASIDNPMGITHMSFKQMKDVLGATHHEVDTASGREMAYRAKVGGDYYRPQPAYDDHQIQVIYRALQDANKSMPWRITGAQNLDVMLTHKMGMLGRAMPESELSRMLENAPTRYTSIRNRFRFTISPEYSMRRLFKAVVKTSMDGIPPTAMPLRALKRMGVEDQALRILDRVMPQWKDSIHDPFYDEGTQVLYANDVMGIYNHRWQEAHAAYHWAQMGKSDEEIKRLLIKDFAYGSEKFGEGRSALERTANFIFFPFSFDKTLYRNTGAYLLDRPLQRMMLTAGLSAYHQWNDQHPNGDVIGTSSWFEDKVPLAQEALKLNAFAHGLSLGQFGGINAPLLNMFLPQSYAASQGALGTLKQMIPAWRELGALGTELVQQGKIVGQWQANFDAHFMHGDKNTPWDPQPVAESDQAQLFDGFKYRREVNAALATPLQWNAHHRVKWTVPKQAKYGPYAGQPFSSTMVDELVHAKYPAFAVSEPATYSDSQRATIAAYEFRMRSSGQTKVADWIVDAQKWALAIYNHQKNIDPAAGTAGVRREAVGFAETIPGFLDFYNTAFRWQFGPLEAVRAP